MIHSSKINHSIDIIKLTSARAIFSCFVDRSCLLNNLKLWYYEIFLFDKECQERSNENFLN